MTEEIEVNLCDINFYQDQTLELEKKIVLYMTSLLKELRIEIKNGIKIKILD